jgi:hypothetical protein
MSAGTWKTSSAIEILVATSRVFLAATLLLVAVVSVFSLSFYSQLLLVLEVMLGTTATVLIASGLLVCFGKNANHIGVTLIEEADKARNEHSRKRPQDAEDHDVDVTIRLETAYARILKRYRCIVTIHDRTGWVQETGKEARHSRDER